MLAFESHTVDGRNLANQLRLVAYPNSYRVFVHPRWCRISSIKSRDCNQWVPCPMKQAQGCFDSETPFLTYESSYLLCSCGVVTSTVHRNKGGKRIHGNVQPQPPASELHPKRPRYNTLRKKNSHTNSYVSGCGLTRENNMFHRNTSTQRCPCFQKMVQFTFTKINEVQNVTLLPKIKENSLLASPGV